MKKFKSILCMALMLVVGCVAFVGCGPKKEDNPPPAIETTITLAEAKTMIVNALAIDEPQAQVMTYALADTTEQGNRDFWAKYHNAELVVSTLANNSESWNATCVIYKNNNITKFHSSEQNGSTKIYSPNKDEYKVYYFNNGQGKIETYTSISEIKNSSLISVFDETIIFPLRTLFKDNAFNKFYDNSVNKSSTQTKDVFTLSIDYKEIFKFENNISDEEWEATSQHYYEMMGISLDEMCSKYVSTLAVEISNNNITQIQFNSKGVSYNGENEFPVEYSVVLTTLNSEFTAPNWVDNPNGGIEESITNISTSQFKNIVKLSLFDKWNGFCAVSNDTMMVFEKDNNSNIVKYIKIDNYYSYSDKEYCDGEYVYKYYDLEPAGKEYKDFTTLSQNYEINLLANAQQVVWNIDQIIRENSTATLQKINYSNGEFDIVLSAYDSNGYGATLTFNFKDNDTILSYSYKAIKSYGSGEVKYYNIELGYSLEENGHTYFKVVEPSWFNANDFGE